MEVALLMVAALMAQADSMGSPIGDLRSQSSLASGGTASGNICMADDIELQYGNACGDYAWVYDSANTREEFNSATATLLHVTDGATAICLPNDSQQLQIGASCGSDSSISWDATYLNIRTSGGDVVHLTDGTTEYQQAQSITTTAGDITINSAGNLIISDTTYLGGSRVYFDADNDASFGSFGVDDNLRIDFNGSGFIVRASNISTIGTSGPAMLNEVASLTNPTFTPHQQNVDNGISGTTTGEVGIVVDSELAFYADYISSTSVDIYEPETRNYTKTFADRNGFARVCTSSEETLTFAANPGDLSKTTTGLVPAGATEIIVAGRVLVLGTNCASFEVGDGSDVDLYGTAIALAAGTTFDITDYTAVPAYLDTDGLEVTLTGSAATNCFSLSVRIVSSYCTYTAPTG